MISDHVISQYILELEGSTLMVSNLTVPLSAATGLALAAVVCGAASGTVADVIPGLYNTGVDDSGAVLPHGSLERHYVLTGPASPAKVINRHPAWVPPPNGSEWIGPYPGDETSPEGIYRYVLDFYLEALDPATAVIHAEVAGDDNWSLYFNGVHIPPGGGFTGLTDVWIETDFQLGRNRLLFLVTNTGTGYLNPSGLLVANIFGSAARCPADFNQDGIIDTLDFLDYLNAWASGDPLADWNDDGDVNTLDFLAFLNDWAAGC